MPQTPDWKRYLATGVQYTEMGRAQARTVAADLVKQGHLARDQVSAAVDEIVANSRRRSDELRALVRTEVERQLGVLGIATQSDLRRLERKVNGDTKKPAKRAVKKATTKRPAKKATAKKATAKKAAAKRPRKKATSKTKTKKAG